MIEYSGGTKSQGSIVLSSVKTLDDLKYILNEHVTYVNQVVTDVVYTEDGLVIQSYIVYPKTLNVRKGKIVIKYDGTIMLGSRNYLLKMKDIDVILFWVETFLRNQNDREVEVGLIRRKLKRYLKSFESIVLNSK